MSPLISYAALAGAIVFEVAGSSMLMKTEQFTRPVPTLIMCVLFGASLYCLSVALKTLPLGIAYAIWGGLGIVLTATVSVVIFRQTLDIAAYIGIAMIVGGVLIMNLISKSAAH